MSGLYDAIEHLFREIASYLNRVSIYLQPSMPPTSDLMYILVRAFVQVLDVLAMATKYCDVAAVESDSSFRKSWIAISRRTSEFAMYHIISLVVLTMRKEDYLREFIGDEDMKAALEKLGELTSAELLAAIAQTNAIARESEVPAIEPFRSVLIFCTVHPWLEFIYESAGMRYRLS